MSATYSMEIIEFNVHDLDGMSDVLKSVKFKIWGELEDGTKLAHPGYIELAPPTPEQFAPYDTLTPEQIESWIVQTAPAGAIDKIKQVLERELLKRSNPGTRKAPAPWEPKVPPEEGK